MRASVRAGSKFGRRACYIGMAKNMVGRSEETEAHIREALRLSPRDTSPTVDDVCGPPSCGTATTMKRSLGCAGASRSTAISRSRISISPRHWRYRGLDDARAAAQAGLALDPGFTIRRFRANGLSNNPNYLAGRERSYKGMRMAGVPEG